jgi:protein gp37
MGAVTKIEWCDHTFNPWWGCTQVSPLCDRCYAMMLDMRWYGRNHWGPGAPRRYFDETLTGVADGWSHNANARNRYIAT